MKSCPTCRRTFEDTFTFCLADGSLLDAPFDPQATQQMPEPRQTEPPPTEVLPAGGVKEEIPPTIASPEPQKKPEELAPTIAAPAPAFESAEVKDSPAQPLRKSKKPLAIIGVVAALIILATVAVFYFAKSAEHRLADVYVYKRIGTQRTTQFNSNDQIDLAVRVQPDEENKALRIKFRLSPIGTQVNTIPDLYPAVGTSYMSGGRYPLSDSLQPGKYKAEVTLLQNDKQLDAKSVDFEVIPDSNETGNTATPTPTPSPTTVVNLDGTVWRVIVTVNGQDFEGLFEFKQNGRIISRWGKSSEDGTWLYAHRGTWKRQGDKVFLDFPKSPYFDHEKYEGTIQGEEMSGHRDNLGREANHDFTARIIK
jgi:hypothetical protein